MTEINPFTHIPPGALLYFHYGLAFIFLGVAIIAKNMRGSRLKLAEPLQYLAIFGFAHGTHEWFELYLVFQRDVMSAEQVLMVKVFGFIVGVISFVFLMEFGLSLLSRTIGGRYRYWSRWLQVVIIIVWLGMVIILWYRDHSLQLSFIGQVDIVTRYCLALTGSIITALALAAYSRKAKRLSETTAKNILLAGVFFLLYGIFAGLIPSKTILPYLNAPVELLRMLSAVFITFFIVKALNIFDIETREMVVEQMKQLAQSEKLASVGHLAAGVAHEINNPLTNASLNVQMVQKILEKRSDSDEKLKTKVEAISRNIERASTIARELLQFSRNEDEDISKVDIHDLIDRALDTLSYRLTKIKVVKQLNSTPCVMGNFGKLQQVFINTLNNAIEAIRDSGEIHVHTMENSEMVTITISDNGIGIPPKKLDNLFDPFFTTKEVGEGTGLGLFICYGIIKQHDGTINIKSQVGEGSHVQLKLPIYHE